MSLDVAHIVSELKRSRHETCQGNDAAQVWTSTMNLIVFTSSRENKQWIIERACRLAQKHPSRLMIFDGTVNSQPITIEATAGGAVSCERIELGVEGVSAKELSSLAEALIVPDVPIVLWWTDKSLDDERFLELTAVVDNVVVDCSGVETGERGIKNLARAMAAARHASFRDLAWGRLASWREQVALFFDEGTFRHELGKLTAIEIASGSSAEALYLAGWFGSRLGLSVCDRTTFCFKNGHEVKVENIRKGEPRRIVSIKITSANNVFSIRAGESWDSIHVSIDGHEGHPEKVAPILSPDNTSLFEHAILARETDETFEAALRTVGELLA